MSNKLSITKLIFVPTGQYQPMGLRPYQINARGDWLSRLETATEGFTQIGRQAFAGIAGSILRPSAQTVGTLSIPNGWQERRYLFMMEIVDEPTDYSMDTTMRITHLKGYTDREGDPSLSGFIDPQMRLFITDVTHTREIANPMNGLPRRRLVDASLLLQRNAGQVNSYGGFYAMRPKDVCVSIGNSHVSEIVGRDYSDYRSSLAVLPTLSNVGNELPSDYLARAVDSYRTAVSTQQRDDVELPDLMANVGAGTLETSLNADPFLQSLHVQTEFSEGACFSYGELCAMFPYLDRDVAKLFPPMEMTRDIGFAAASPQDSKEWTGSSMDTVAATILSSSVPAAMTYAMLTQVSFYVTNDTVDGQPRFEFLSSPQSFMTRNQSLDNNAIYFRDMILGEIFRDLTMNGNVTVSLSLFCDLVQCDMRLTIEVDGQGRVDYTAPTFARGMTTPVIANNRDQLDNLAHNLGDVFSQMKPSDMGYHGDDVYDPGYGRDAFTVGNQPLSRIMTPDSNDSGSFSL